ncbi:protein S100-P-like [Centroberyx affinis]|uniref:protein S100-P-like n=1 Tax=Centroberyx affinis TaxID=166261 RepID=UPI003A5BA5E7
MDMKLQTAMVLLLETFKEYASAEGNPKTLTKNEVMELYKKELPAFLEGAKDQGEVDELLRAMDHDGNAEVDFTEFMHMVGALTCAAHGFDQQK